MSPEAIRGRALECVHLAQNTADLQHRALLLNMAYSWADLANSADQFQMMIEAAEGGSNDLVGPRFRGRKARPPRARAFAQKRAIKRPSRLRRYR